MITFEEINPRNCMVKMKITCIGGLTIVLFKGTKSFSSSSKGSLYWVSCHHTEPLPSIMPFPWIVNPTSFVKSNHCNSPLPQALEFVGAIMVPSTWKNTHPKYDFEHLGVVVNMEVLIAAPFSHVKKMLPGKRFWVYSMGPKKQWAPHRRCNLLEWAWLMPLLYMLHPMWLQMPAFSFQPKIENKLSYFNYNTNFYHKKLYKLIISHQYFSWFISYQY